MRFGIMLTALSVLGLSACGGSGGSSSPAPPAPPPPPATFTIAGTLGGLNGTAVLQNNGGDNLTISSSGAFTFATRVTSGSAYAVTVLTQPATQTCAVTGGSGTATGNVTQVAIACVDNPPPAPVAPLVDDARAVSGEVGIGGGTVSVTSAGGITYALEVPAGAVDATVEIRMAPVVNMGGAPLAAGLLGAVRFEPAGLRFRVPARLTMSGLPLFGGRPLLVGFDTANDGSDFNFDAAERVGTSVIVDVRHFSIAGASEATEAELAEIPLEPLGPIFTGDEANSAIHNLLLNGRGENVEQAAEVLLRWYQTLVQPAVDGAISTDLDSQEGALYVYMDWRGSYDRLLELGIDAARLNPRLSTAFAHANEHMPDLLLRMVDGYLDGCLEEESVAHLTIASMIQQFSVRLGFAPAGSPLERVAFRERVNNCLRVVLDPITLPSPLTVGQDSSLDARAQVVFNGNPNPAAAPFEFTVTPTNASVATSPGFSSADGGFTTVFRPTALPVTLVVRACLVSLDICASQTVASAGDPLVMTKRFIYPEGLSDAVDSFIVQATGTDQPGTTVSYAISRDTVNAVDRGGSIDARASCVSTQATRSGATSIHFQILVNLTTPASIRIRGTPAYVGSTGSNPLGTGIASVVVARLIGSSTGPGVGASANSSLGTVAPFEILVPAAVGEYVIAMAMTAECTSFGTASITNTFELVFE